MSGLAGTSHKKFRGFVLSVDEYPRQGKLKKVVQRVERGFNQKQAKCRL
jgi:hypothetical protein